ncbi:glycosyltransferase family 2 protein [Sphingomonas daechungensis]|uniref:glycosyltransferase family 2 protein n=1 Tax=Sphingomonas daechungensis TaxID=1176646 RepID=UPI003783C6AE
MFDIVMPLFNKEIYVARTIESVLTQRFRDWKLYVVDDGSSDNGASVVEGFGDPRIALIRQENAGPGAARNTGIIAGSSDWIAFLDADDIWLPDHLKVLNDLRQAFPGAALIGNAYVHWTGGDVPVPPEAGKMREVRYFHEASRGRAPFFTSSAAFSRSGIDHVGLLAPVVIGDEMDFWARLALHGQVAASTQPTVLYRVGTGGITDSSVADDIVSLDQVSLPVATLLERIPGISDPQLKQDVIDYIDFDAGLALTRALRTGRLANARRLRKLFIEGPRGKARIAAWLARLPAPIGQKILHVIFASKQALQSR